MAGLPPVLPAGDRGPVEAAATSSRRAMLDFAPKEPGRARHIIDTPHTDLYLVLVTAKALVLRHRGWPRGLHLSGTERIVADIA